MEEKEKKRGIFLQIQDILLRLLASAAAGAFIGLERGRNGRAAGLRTHMLISIGAAMTVIVGACMSEIYGGDSTRIPAGVVSGIGFIGAGIILIKGSSRITGLTTAAAMWATAAVGLAYGCGLWVAGVAGTALTLLVLMVMPYFEVNQKMDRLFFVEIADAYETNRVLEEIKEKFPTAHSVDILPPKSGHPDRVGISINIMNRGESWEIVREIRKISGVVFVVRE